MINPRILRVQILNIFLSVLTVVFLVFLLKVDDFFFSPLPEALEWVA